MEEKKSISSIKFFFLFLFFFLAGVILYARFVSTKGLTVKEYPIYNEKINANFEGLKIVHFSDILYGRTVNKKDIASLVKKINDLRPDIVVFTGDIIDKDTIYKNSLGDYFTKELAKIDARLAKYAVMGDYDAKIKDYEIIMKNAGFVILKNSGELLYDKGSTPLFICGVDSLLKGSIDTDSAFNVLMENPESDFYKIVLAHEPDSYDKFKDYNPDLVLSGHSLNGQVRLPYVGAIAMRKGSQKYYNSYYKLKNTDFYISGGIGTTNYNFRWFNKPSINLYRLYKS